MSWGSEMTDDTCSTSSHVCDDCESEVFENKSALSQDLKFLSGMPELCDVMFLVGEEKIPVYGVKAILSIRSRVFYKMLFGPKSCCGQKSQPKSPGSPGPQSVRKTISKLFESSHTKDTSTNWKLAYPHQQHQQSLTGLSQPQRSVIHIDEFEPEVFKDLVEYVHTGAVVLKPRSLLGLLNAADHFSLEELRRACVSYSQKSITLETVCSLLVSAEHYVQYKSTKILLQKVLEFVDSHGDEVLQLPEFVHLPRHVVELILAREELKATDLNKYRAVERWATNFVTSNYGATLPVVMAPFLQYVQFHLVPTNVLMKEIRPLGLVPESLLLTALAYQADPLSVTAADLRIGQTSPRPPKAKWSPGAAGRSMSVEADLNLTATNDSLSRDSGFYEPTVVRVEPDFQPFILKIPFSRAKSQLELQSISMRL